MCDFINKWLNVIKYGCLVIVILGLISSIIPLHLKKEPEKEPVKLVCFTCTTLINLNLSKEVLPMEEECLQRPIHTVECQFGQLCGFSELRVRNMTRITRKCVTGTEVGCESTLNGRGRICYCSNNLCM